MAMNITYKGSREEMDMAAIQDCENWFGEEQFALLADAIQRCETPGDVQGINMSMAFSGVSGKPFHAMLRKYNLTAYRAWMHDGPDAVRTDAQGFALG
jgi:hypothetical protein